MKTHYSLYRLVKGFALYLLLLLFSGKLFAQNLSESVNYFPRSLNMHLDLGAGNALMQEQTSNTTMRSIIFRPLPTTVPPRSTPQYDMHTIQKNLKLDRRLIISGSVLAGTGVASFLIGVIFAFPYGGNSSVSYDTVRNPSTGATTVEKVSEKSMGTFIPFSMFMLGSCLVGTGVPLFSVGLAQRHKWKQRRDAFNIKAGILTGNQMGMVMNF